MLGKLHGDRPRQLHRFATGFSGEAAAALELFKDDRHKEISFPSEMSFDAFQHFEGVHLGDSKENA